MVAKEAPNIGPIQKPALPPVEKILILRALFPSDRPFTILAASGWNMALPIPIRVTATKIRV
jgi:hypothetical protein